MIYLDNAATTLRKPREVIDAVAGAMGTLGNAGRGAGGSALDASRALLRAREAVARLLGCPRADRVCFAAGATAALNTAIAGVVRPGDRVVTTVLEHNSVLRPLARLADTRGVEVRYAPCDAHGFLDMRALERMVTPGTRAVVCTHASNVTGDVVDVAGVARIAHAAGAVCIVDAAQTAGAVPVDMASMGIDVACFAGHKGPMGPMGTGGLAVAGDVDVRPLVEGGTGVRSFDRRQPEEWPTRLEAGTQNVPGIAGLAAGISFIEARGGVAAVGAREHALAARLYEGVRSIPGVTVYGGWPVAPERCCGIVALNVEGAGSAAVADALMQGWGIAVRAGAHCAPLMHRALGTVEQGVVRFSTSWFTEEDEIDAAVEAVRAIAGAQPGTRRGPGAGREKPCWSS